MTKINKLHHGNDTMFTTSTHNFLQISLVLYSDHAQYCSCLLTCASLTNQSSCTAHIQSECNSWSKYQSNHYRKI